METTEEITGFKNKWSKLIHRIRWINLFPLIMANIYNATVSTFYVFMAMLSLVSFPPLALMLAIFMGTGNLFITLMVAYNTMEEKNIDTDTSSKDSKIKTNIFLFFAIVSLLFNCASNVIGPYISLGLIGSAFSLPVTSQGFILISLGIGIFTALAFALYNIVQIYEVYQRLNPSLYIEIREEPSRTASPSDFLSSTEKIKNISPIKRPMNVSGLSAKSEIQVTAVYNS